MKLPRVPFMIAEIGINHNGNVETAKRLIKMAKDCDCDSVKFQKRDVETVYTGEFLDSPRESPWGTTQRDQKMGLEFGKLEYDMIDEYCKKLEMPWFASAWDIKSLNFLRAYRMPYHKIASAMITDIDFVREVAKDGIFTFISTGGSTLRDIFDAVDVFDEHETPFLLMQCNSCYPAPDEDLNLAVIAKFNRKFDLKMGYSGHEVGIFPSALAVSLGALAVERHITLDRSSYGTDQPASVEKRGLELLVRDCRSVKEIMGTGIKVPTEKELQIIKKLRDKRKCCLGASQ